MNDDNELFEAELRRLQPRNPSPGLSARIARSLDQREPEPRRRASRVDFSWRWLAGLAAASAAAGIVAVVVVRQRPPDALVPVEITNVVYDTADEGVVTLGDGTPARRIRVRSVDTITWKNPRTLASLQWSEPREDVRDILYTYN